MNKEAQRIAIAEACGWKPLKQPYPKYGTNQIMWWSKDKEEVEELPDYLNDLNSCHAMEKVLKRDQRYMYVKALNEISDFESIVLEQAFFDMYVHATAAQRAEAFLRVLGLWKEEPPKV